LLCFVMLILLQFHVLEVCTHCQNAVNLPTLNTFGLCLMGVAMEVVKLSIISVLYTIFLVMPFSYLLIPFP
jgi:hypothetical protein